MDYDYHTPNYILNLQYCFDYMVNRSRKSIASIMEYLREHQTSQMVRELE